MTDNVYALTAFEAPRTTGMMMAGTVVSCCRMCS